MTADVAGAAGDEYGGHWIVIFVHGNIRKRAKVKSVCPRNTRKNTENGENQRQKKQGRIYACGARAEARSRRIISSEESRSGMNYIFPEKRFSDHLIFRVIVFIFQV